MASTRVFRQSFSGGELTPEFFGRIDDAKFSAGAATMRNFIALPHGPAANRPGTQYVRTTKDSTKRSRLIPFVYSNSQAFAVELGDGYIRWHTGGASLLYGAHAAWAGATTYFTGDIVEQGGLYYQALALSTALSPAGNPTYWYPLPATGEYQIASPYAEADLFDIHYTQSADVVTLVHPNYAPMELRRLGATYWTLTTISFVSTLSPPASPTVAPTTGTGTTLYRYKVSTIGDDGLNESLAAAHTGPVATINAITNANPGVIQTTVAHGLAVGQEVTISGVLGMTAINGSYIVSNVGVGLPIFSVKPAGGVPVDTTGFGAYTSGGTVTPKGCTNNLLTTGNINTLSWTAAAGARRYNVYKESNSLYGYIGQTDSTSFVDDNITPDMSKTPPEASNPFSGAGNYPGAVGYFEQRRCFAGTTNSPQTLAMTRTGTESNLSFSIPTRADDAISIKVASREVSTIRHIVPMSSIVLLTSSTEFRVTSINSDAITPSSISVRPQSYIGSSNVQPSIVNNNLIYAAARGGHVRELSYDWKANGYLTGDLSLRAPHLFDNLTIADMAYAKCPQPICWFVSSNGNLLGLTYIPEQQIGAWHRHDTDGAFESVCVIPEGNEDSLYCIVNRTINGATRRYVERLASRQFTDQEDAVFADCSLTYSGSPATTISGLTHLEGKTVSILADGAVCARQVVTGGAITLGTAASTVQVGLPIEADLQTLPMAAGIDGAYGQGRTKNINRAWLRVYRSGGIFVGPDANHLTEARMRRTETLDGPVTLRSEEIPIMVTPSWGSDGQVFIRQTDPLPLTVVSLTLEVAIGG